MTQVCKRGLGMKSIWALGLAERQDGSGLLASLLFTDGWSIGESRPSLTLPYPVSLREHLRETRENILAHKKGTDGSEEKQETFRNMQFYAFDKLSREITSWFLQISRTLIDKTKILPSVVGFSGVRFLSEASSQEENSSQVVVETLSEKIHCPVVSNFERDDRTQGGTGEFVGAPYFQTLVWQAMKKGTLSSEKKVAIMTIEDQSKALILGPDIPPRGFVVGPGFCLVDELTQRVFQTIDFDGKMAGRGDLDNALVKKWIKDLSSEETCSSVERFRPCMEYCLRNLTPLDGIATLVAFTAQFIERRMKVYPDLKTLLLLGERATRNFFMQSLLSRKFSIILPRDIGWNTDFIESEIYAFLAVRRFYDIPVSYPTTKSLSKSFPVGQIFNFRKA